MLHNRDVIPSTIQTGIVSNSEVVVGGKVVCSAPSGAADGDTVTVTRVNGVVVASK